MKKIRERLSLPLLIHFGVTLICMALFAIITLISLLIKNETLVLYISLIQVVFTIFLYHFIMRKFISERGEENKKDMDLFVYILFFLNLSLSILAMFMINSQEVKTIDLGFVVLFIINVLNFGFTPLIGLFVSSIESSNVISMTLPSILLPITIYSLNKIIKPKKQKVRKKGKARKKVKEEETN